MKEKQERLDEIIELLEQGRSSRMEECILSGIEEGIPVRDILEKGLLVGMNRVSTRFMNDEIFVPEVLIAAYAMSKGTKLLHPYLVKDGNRSQGTIVLGTVRGDIHDIGKNLVKMMMEGRSLKVVDLGIDTPPEKFVEAAIAEHADIIACSALLTSTIGELKHIVDAVHQSELRDKVPVMIGGGPVTQDFCNYIHADYYTKNAVEAADAALRFCQNKHF